MIGDAVKGYTFLAPTVYCRELCNMPSSQQRPQLTWRHCVREDASLAWTLLIYAQYSLDYTVNDLNASGSDALRVVCKVSEFLVVETLAIGFNIG
jgi:hypothetical protein